MLTNAKAYLNKEIVECNLAIENGEIFKIGKEAHMPKADETINLKNLLVLPGMIDAHVHLRDEEKSYKEDFYTGTAAAAAGGVTTVLDMPNNSPVTMSAKALKNRVQIAKRKILVNVGFYSEFPNNLGETANIVDGGATAFKLFMASQIGGLTIDNDQELKRAFRKVGDLDVPVAVHAEDRGILTVAEENQKKANRHDASAFLEAHSERVEFKAIERLLKLSAQINMRLHFCHVSTKEGLALISGAKKSGRSVTCEVTPNHLLLTEKDFECYGSLLAIMPPLRNTIHIESLWKGIVDGWVDNVGSDHAPHSLKEKSAGSIWDVKVGVPGLETSLPLLLTMVRKNRLSLAKLVYLFSEKPAEIFDLKDRGKLEQGKKADLVAINFNQKFKIDSSKFHSKAKYSPYEGWKLQGRPEKTFVNGLLVMDDQEIVAKAGNGGIIRRDPV